MCIPCPNSELCGIKAFPGMAGQICSMCRTLVGRSFDFVDLARPEACVVCMEESARFVAHPSGCGHRACVACTREMWFPEPPANVCMGRYGIELRCSCEECSQVLSDGTRWPCKAEWDRIEKRYPNEIYAMIVDIMRVEHEYYHNLDERADPHNCFICRRHHHVPGLCNNEDCPLH